MIFFTFFMKYRPRIVPRALHISKFSWGGDPHTPRKDGLLPINIHTIKFRTLLMLFLLRINLCRFVLDPLNHQSSNIPDIIENRINPIYIPLVIYPYVGVQLIDMISCMLEFTI